MTVGDKDRSIELLLRIVDEAFDRRGWHGATLKGSLRGLKLAAACWRPGPKRHNIWELILHTAYWKYIVRRRLTRGMTLKFPRSPSDWPAPPKKPTMKQLKADISLLQEQHTLLREAITQFPTTQLRRRAPESQWTYAEHIHGIAAHDLHHTGQIQLLKRLIGR